MKRPEKKTEKLPKVIIYTIALLASFVYIVYRIVFTLPLNLRLIDIVFGLVIIIAEIIELIEFFAYYWNILRFKKKSPKVPKVDEKDLPDVDVFIATLNESDELLEGTLRACAKMEYPKSKKHIYLCDDGEREHLRDLAKKHSATYLARTNHNFAKAGNYNFALKHSNSPYIAIFDADMRPRKRFLLKTMPFFIQRKNVGFVQTPQSFKNPDIFQARLSSELPFEQDYFYHYIQIARNRTNSTIMCGTNCVLSREALKAAGGFASASIAEDVATGMLIEAKGFRGIAINRVLAYGEAIDNLSGFLRQRSRWGRGCIQTARAYGIFSLKGLNWRQKLDYFTAINYWCFGLRRLLYLALPFLFIFFHITAIQANIWVFIPIFLVQYFLKRFVIDLLEGKYKSSTWMKIFELIQAPFLAVVVLKELVGLSSKKFVVTKKTGSAKKSIADWLLLLVHFALFAVSVYGVYFAYNKIDEFGPEICIVPMIWMAINAGYLAIAMLFDLRKSRRYANFEPNKNEKYKIRAVFGLLWRKK